MTRASTLSFGDFELDLARGELRRLGQVVPIEPQVLDMIGYFASQSGSVVTRDDLIEYVWGGRIVSDSTIDSRINAARDALGDDGKAQRMIKTIPRRGFRFEAKVFEAAVRPVPTIRDKPSVAVLPFQNMSGDPEQAYFSDGITDDVITDLSRYDELFVIARHSSFAYRNSTLSTAEIASELGVQYIGEGSVRRAGNRIRVTAQLIDPHAGQQLWAERFDRELEDIFEVQDEIAEVIVNTLAGQIERQHYQRSLSKRSEAVDAYDHLLRAFDLNLRLTPDSVKSARNEANEALALDADFSRAHALIAWTLISECANAWADDPVLALEMAGEHAAAAVTKDDREPFGHMVLGWVYMWRDADFSRGLAEQRRSIALNPASAHVRGLHAFSQAYSGQSTEAIDALRHAMEVNPHYPELYHAFLGRALFNLHRYDEAMPHLERIRSSMPLHANAIAHAAACYAALGRENAAREAVAEVVRASSGYTVSYARRYIPYAKTGEKAHYIENLIKAGLPER